MGDAYCQRCPRTVDKTTFGFHGWSRLRLRVKRRGRTKRMLCDNCTTALIRFLGGEHA